MLKLIKKILQFFGLIESDLDKSAREKGVIGEKNVARVFNKNNIKYLSNLYLPHYYGYSEIDLLIITSVGIFITEVKNYNNCTVKGTEQDEYWDVEYKSGKNYTMYNPIKQNENHIRTLLKHIEPNRIPLYSLVVFSDKAELDIKYNSGRVFVINENNLEELINRLNGSRTILNEKEINNIYSKLQKYTIVSDKVKKDHIKRVSSYRKHKEGGRK